MPFVARKYTPDSLRLFREGEDVHFATLTRVPPNKWVLTSTDAKLVDTFNHTPLTDDVTPRGVLWAIRAMIELTPDNCPHPEIPPWRRVAPKPAPGPKAVPSPSVTTALSSLVPA